MRSKITGRAGPWDVAYAVACGVLLTVAVGNALLTAATFFDLTSVAFARQGDGLKALGFAALPLVGALIWLPLRRRFKRTGVRRGLDLALLALALAVDIGGLNAIPVVVAQA